MVTSMVRTSILFMIVMVAIALCAAVFEFFWYVMAGIVLAIVLLISLTARIMGEDQ